MSERFGALRSILQKTPSEAVWREIVDELGLWGEEERDAVALLYVADHLDRWPVEVVRWADGGDPAWRRRLATGGQARSAEEVRAMVAGGDAGRLVALRVWGGEAGEALRAESGRFGRVESMALHTDKGREAAALMGVRWPATLRSLEVSLSYPITRVWGRRVAQVIAQNETLGGLEVLSLYGVGMGDGGAAALAASPHLRSLRELDLSYNQIGPAGAKMLADSALLDGVTRLNLWGDRPGMGLVALVSSPHTRALRSLNINKVEISAACARGLAAAAWPPELEELELELDELNARALLAMAGAPVLRVLRELSVSVTPMPGIAQLLASQHLVNVNKLWVYGIHEAAWEAMCGNAALAGVEQLSVEGESLTAEQVRALGQSVMGAGLVALNMELAQHTDVAALFERAAWPALRWLRLSGRDTRGGYHETYAPMLSDEGLARLVACGVIARLEELLLQYNQLGDVAAVALADSGQLGGLRELELAHNQLGDEGLIALIERGGMDNPRALGLAENEIGDVGAAALADSPLLRALKPHSMKHTPAGSLRYNKIGRAGVLALLRSPHLDALEELELYGNPLTHEDVVALAATPEIGRLRGALRVSATDAREETWQALIDSPYANEATRECATNLLQNLRDAQRRRAR